jgi:hypothetical protein
MRVFTNDTDTVVAIKLEDVPDWLLEQYGGDVEDYETKDWEEVPPDRYITIWCDADGDPTEPEEDGATEIMRTAAEWAALRGAGFLCSTDF